MRIIAGLLKGRAFDAPHGHKTHPMSEKVRGAIFNVLGDVSGLTVFDAFAGSGAIAFEALSRGAKSAVLSDLSIEATKAMQRSAETLDLVKTAKVVRANASGWSDNNPGALFDIVVADPPYDDIPSSLLSKLGRHVKLNGLYILSLPPRHQIDNWTDFELQLKKDYGDATVWFFKRLSAGK